MLSRTTFALLVALAATQASSKCVLKMNARYPYGGGSPISVRLTSPTEIPAVNYDCGGTAFNTYSDTTAGNTGGFGTRADSVDIFDSGSGVAAVGWISTNEYLTYSVTVMESGWYDISFEWAGDAGSSGSAALFLDGTAVGPVFWLGDTNGWSTFTYQRRLQVFIAASTSTQILKFVSHMHHKFNLRTIKFAASPCPQVPTPIDTPAGIRSVDYNCGGQNVGHYDTTPGNFGAFGVRNDEVDIFNSGSGAPAVGWIDTNDWLEYTVSVPATGDYNMFVEWAGGASQGTLEVSLGGVSLGSLALGNTGGWYTFQYAQKHTMALSATTSAVLRVRSAHHYQFNLRTMRFELVATPTPPTPFPPTPVPPTPVPTPVPTPTPPTPIPPTPLPPPPPPQVSGCSLLLAYAWGGNQCHHISVDEPIVYNSFGDANGCPGAASPSLAFGAPGPVGQPNAAAMFKGSNGVSVADGDVVTVKFRLASNGVPGSISVVTYLQGSNLDWCGTVTFAAGVDFTLQCHVTGALSPNPVIMVFADEPSPALIYFTTFEAYATQRATTILDITGSTTTCGHPTTIIALNHPMVPSNFGTSCGGANTAASYGMPSGWGGSPSGPFVDFKHPDGQYVFAGESLTITVKLWAPPASGPFPPDVNFGVVTPTGAASHKGSRSLVHDTPITFTFTSSYTGPLRVRLSSWVTGYTPVLVQSIKVTREPQCSA